jgi:hypothetical protein
MLRRACSYQEAAAADALAGPGHRRPEAPADSFVARHNQVTHYRTSAYAAGSGAPAAVQFTRLVVALHFAYDNFIQRFR